MPKPELKPTRINPGSAGAELSQEQINELAASAMTFREIEKAYGEEVAINVGIARDPDAPEITEEQFAQMRPALEVVPDLVEKSLRKRCQEQPERRDYVTIPIDNDLLRHFLDAAGPGWHQRLNDTLRQAVFAPESH